MSSARASKLVNPNLVFKKRLQFHKKISDVQISFAHKPHDQEKHVIEVKCGSAQAPCLLA
jgi:F0F1-type ATP synthase delta subunit